ncbi:MAG: peptidylprolyl isomerase [Planctomycetes bacterium]|nr:peptidylprolyl isomerase [Planctomycetota bacterium]
MEGTQAPSPFEVLWERYKSLILTIIAAIFLALLGHYAWKYFEQKAVDENWSQFAASIGINENYVDFAKAGEPLTKTLEDIEMATLEEGLGKANDAQRPYFLLAIARKAILEKEWERAESALAEIESKYPKHTLVVTSKAPVQGRDQKEPPEGERPEIPEFEPAQEGSVVSLMRKQIEDSKSFELPAAFKKPEIPADAKKVKFTFGDYGSATIALMPQAPKHAAKFLELAQQEGGAFWKGLAVDEIQRSTENFERPYAMHFGFASTREDDRTKWTTTEPSEHQLDWEDTGLSHFEGAVSARPEADGKSCADRIWIHVDDQADLDGSRVVFGYVVEGMDVLRSICEAGMSAEEEDRGQGRPTENIRITEVEVL